MEFIARRSRNQIPALTCVAIHSLIPFLFFSANLCVLCASAVKKEEIATAEAQSTQRFAEKEFFDPAFIFKE